MPRTPARVTQADNARAIRAMRAAGYPIADVLFERCTPFLFATGYAQQGLEPAYQAVPVMQKPYQVAQIEYLLLRLLTGEVPAKRHGLRLVSGCTCQDADSLHQGPCSSA